MTIFQKTASEQAKINEFLSFAEEKLSTLSEYAEYVSVSELKNIRDSFVSQTDDFYRKDRKFNIGVIGQVKAGKSTFLNTLLFDGADVLPSARTPKTATLTKIEYAETNSILVEYYMPEEWIILENYAKSDLAGDEYEAAREIMRMVSENEIHPSEYLAKGSDEIHFESADELMGQLNEYVGENGRLTPLVKNVIIRINKPELAEISVVDTPGLNDAVASRTDKTREFIEKCDVVFFLSRASYFLDANDMKLLTAQLPQKGVEHLILLCSQFDGGVLDELKKNDSLRKAIDSVKNKLLGQFREIVGSEKQRNEVFAAAMEKCSEPIFISSMMYNLSRKDAAGYTRNDNFLFKRFNKYGDLTKEIMCEIGNIDRVRNVFNEIVADKDVVLQHRNRQIHRVLKKNGAGL